MTIRWGPESQGTKTPEKQAEMITMVGRLGQASSSREAISDGEIMYILPITSSTAPSGEPCEV